MKIHKETIASELQLLIDGVNSKEQAVEEIAAYIRWRDKQFAIHDVVVSEAECEHPRDSLIMCGDMTTMFKCGKCGKSLNEH